MVAFAEQLGRMAGTLQAKAEGWLDRETLTKQVASVRDSATELLEQLAGGAMKGSKRNLAATAAPGKTKGRSGGVVDAPGKNIVSRCRPIPARTLRTVRRPRCGWLGRWSRRTGVAGAAS